MESSSVRDCQQCSASTKLPSLVLWCGKVCWRHLGILPHCPVLHPLWKLTCLLDFAFTVYVTVTPGLSCMVPINQLMCYGAIQIIIIIIIIIILLLLLLLLLFVKLWCMPSPMPNLRIRFQPQSITAYWPVSNYTAW